MDRKSIIVLVACFVLLVIWFPLVNKLYPPKPLPPGSTNAVAAASQTNPPAQTNVTPPPTTGAPATPASAPSADQFVKPEAPEQLLTVTRDDLRYTFTSYGGGIKVIDLLKYPESTRNSGGEGTNQVATLNSPDVVPVLTVLGDLGLSGSAYTLTETANGVQAETVLSNGLAVVKQFQFTSNYLFTAAVRFENRSDQPIHLPEYKVVVGTATPMNPQDNEMAVGAMWYNGDKLKDVSSRWFANRTLGCLPGTPRSQYVGGNSNVVWTAAHNQFFALAAIPETNAASVVIDKQELPKPTAEEINEGHRINKNPLAFRVQLVEPGTTLAPGASSSKSYRFYAGPKEYRRLAHLAEELGNNLDLVMGYGGFFGFFSKLLLLGMNMLHDIFSLPYGFAIVAITVIIKLLFWPLTQASTRSMKRMQALQPQMKALQAKYKDDPAKMNKKLMEFMREHKVSPLGGCLPMVLQIPVFFGFFKMIRSAIELRGAHFLWVKDLSQPDTLFLIPGTHFPFNLLPLIMGVTMLWQARMQPPSPGMDPAQQKLMRYMPLMFLVILYNYSAGLTLYWTVQNLLTIVQMKLTRAKDPATAQPATAPARPVKRKK